MTTGTVKQRPLYSCVSCMDIQSFPADELKVYDDSCYCSECWSEHDLDTEHGIEWVDLTDFSPAAEAEAALNEALQQVKSLTAALAKETVRKEAAYANEQRLENDNLELRRRIFARFNEDECWIFQDDGHDYPESLVCPVVMSAGTLRELVLARSERDEMAAHRDLIISQLAAKVERLSGYIVECNAERKVPCDIDLLLDETTKNDAGVR